MSNGRNGEKWRGGRAIEYRRKRRTHRVNGYVRPFAFIGPLSSSALLLVWKLACASPRCENRRFRIGQRKAIIRIHLLSETGSDYVGLVRSTGLEPVRSPTRPSNVRVCQFRHDRRTGIIISPVWRFVKGAFGENFETCEGRRAWVGARRRGQKFSG